MAYKTSRARKNLQDSYTDIYARLRAANGRGIHPNIREYVIAASIFLAHAGLENFIADIFSDFATGAKSIATKGSLLPGELQAHLFLSKANAQNTFGKYVASNSEKELIKSFMAALKGPAGTIVNDSVTIANFTGQDIYTQLKYPSKENLKKLFYRVGVSNIFDKLNALLKQDSIALLESLGSLRTQLAHTGTLPGISCNDVRDRIRDTERFAGAIDRLMFTTVSSNFGSPIWLRHVC